jgi:hypothetical protein
MNTIEQQQFAFLATVPRTEWVPTADCRRRLDLGREQLDRLIQRAGLEVRWHGGWLRPNGQRSQRIRLVELHAVRGALRRAAR